MGVLRNHDRSARGRAHWLAVTLLAAGLGATSLENAAALTVTAVTSGNGYPAHKVQWTDSAGQPRSAVLVDQTTSGPGYLYQLTYQVNGTNRVCTGPSTTGYPGDGFVQNHVANGDESNSKDDSVPGTIAILLSGSNHAIIEYSMPTYSIPDYINDTGHTVPTTIYWFFADGRSHPIFAISQDARATAGNLGADTRSPYGSFNFDGSGQAEVGGASYGDTYKFVTPTNGSASNVAVTGYSGWTDTVTNTIPYAMEWAVPSQVDAEWGHVATLPITVQDEGTDRGSDADTDARNSQARNGPLLEDGSWAFQVLDYLGLDGNNDPLSIEWSKLAWGGNFGRVGGFDNYNYGGSGLNVTQYSAHYNCGANILTGTRLDGMLCAYSVFVVLGIHNGSYTNGSVGQEVIQMQNVTAATLSRATGTVATSGPAGVGSAASQTITYSPAGYNPIYAAWELSASNNLVNATLTPGTQAPLDHPIFMVDQYTSSQLPASLSVGAGLTNAGVDYFASVDTTAQRLWITINRLVTNSLNLVVGGASGGGTAAPAIFSFTTSAQLGASIIINGTNFTGATSVTFDGVAASFTVNSSTKITATVPALATPGPITVTTPGGTAQSTASFTIQAASTNLLIYVDSLLNGFDGDYSWANNYNFANTSPVYAGSDSIGVTAAQYTAVWTYHAPFNTSPYASLSFWINGGAAGAQGVAIMGVTNNNYTAMYALPNLPTNGWIQFDLPLSAIGAASLTNCDGFWFYATLPGTTTFYLDSIQLNTATAPALTPVSRATASDAFVLQLSGYSGQSYTIQTSTNLINWTPVSTNTIISVSLNITNSITAHAKQQYWRAYLP